MLCGLLLVIYICEIRLDMYAVSHWCGIDQDVVFTFMTRSDWVSPLICLSGLRFWLWCCDLGQWLWLCTDHPRSSEWKHPGGLCGVLPPARQGKCWPPIMTHSHQASRHYRLFRAHRGPAFVFHCPSFSISSPSLSFWSWCVVALMGWVMGWWTRLFIFRLLPPTETQSASLNLWLPTQTNATR